MLRADLQNESDTIRAYRDRVRQCKSLGEFGIAEDIREVSATAPFMTLMQVGTLFAQCLHDVCAGV
jgi:hypothetical protein